jgi:hypothetical protein
MRRHHMDKARSRIALIAAALVAATVMASACEARRAPAPDARTGCPSILINRPTCLPGDGFDEPTDCAEIEWSLANNCSYRAFR